MEQLLNLGEYIILGFATPTMTKELDKDMTRQELLTTTRTIGQFFFTIHISFHNTSKHFMFAFVYQSLDK